MLAVDFFFCTIEALGTLTFSVVTVSFSDAFVDDLVEATLAVFGTLAVTETLPMNMNFSWWEQNWLFSACC